uniref:Uncharacterized protein n=1 Tax=Arundo donax TaxID=35708 RepID=A0A0A9G445_ARUDO
MPSVQLFSEATCKLLGCCGLVASKCLH